MAKFYSYFFTRQDISAEQQIVQTAHAALQLGVVSQDAPDPDKGVEYVPHQTSAINPKETYFTVVGVRNQDALLAVASILDKFGYRHEMFFEPDLGEQGEYTSIAVYPVEEFRKGPLLAFGLLKVSKN